MARRRNMGLRGFRYAIQSNRVIRRYKGNEEAFLRVDFR
jgi:hypothetical protein